MKILIALIVLAVSFWSCEENGFIKDPSMGNDPLDTRCTIVFVEGQLAGDIDTNFEANGNSSNGVTAYSTPNGIYVKGEQNDVSITVGIPFYSGPGDYAISNITTVTITITNAANQVSTYVSASGVITMQEFRSPTNEMCVKGVFTIKAPISNSELNGSISVTNGEFEAVVS